MRASHWRPRWPATALLAGVLLASGAAAGHTLTRPPDHNFGAVPAAAPASAAVAARQGAASSHRAAAAPAQIAVAAIAAPTRLRIHAIAIDAPVVPVGVATGGTLNIPADPSSSAGGLAAARRCAAGATVLVGHVDTVRLARGTVPPRVMRPGAGYHAADRRPHLPMRHASDARLRQSRLARRRHLQPAGRSPAGHCHLPRPVEPGDARCLDDVVVYAVPVRPAR